MEFEDMMSDYQNDDTNKSRDVLRGMHRATGHPVLKKIRKQLIFESLIWGVVLSVYYSGFDGVQKTFFWNAVLVVAIVLLLVHNLLGYRLVQTPINAQNLMDSLKGYLKRIKRYALISIATRVLAVMAILLFLTSNVEWNINKIVATGTTVFVLISLQIYFLWKLWKKRMVIIETQINSLKSNID